MTDKMLNAGETWPGAFAPAFLHAGTFRDIQKQTAARHTPARWPV